MNHPPSAPASPPPFRLPGEHFAAALLWLLLLGALVPWIAPSLAQGNIFAPRVLAATHVLTLGVLTTMIFGALYQFFPATLGVGVRSVAVAHGTFWTLQAGVIVMVAGFWWWVPLLLFTGWILLFLAVGGLSWNLLPQRRRAVQGLMVGRYVSLGHMALGLAMGLGLARIGEPLGWWAVSRTGFIAAHFHLGAFGFITLTIVGVGSRMVPMFLFAQSAPIWPLRLIGPLASAGLLLHAAGLTLDGDLATAAGGLLLGVAAVLLLWQFGLWFHHRTRRAIDPGIAFMLISFGFFLATTIAGVGLLVAGQFNPQRWAAYAVVALFGWALHFTLGISHRIVPFLSWLHLFGGMSRGAHAPPVTALVHRGVAWFSLATLATGVGTLALGVQLGHAPLATIGGSSVALGIAALGGQVGRGIWLWRSTPLDPPPQQPTTPRPIRRPLEVLS